MQRPGAMAAWVGGRSNSPHDIPLSDRLLEDNDDPALAAMPCIDELFCFEIVLPSDSADR